MRILFAEDEKSLNKIITKQLKAAGYSVDSCFDGGEAYDLITMTDYDAAIFDVMMPVMNGFELVKKIRAKGIDVPVLFLTARDSIEDRVTGLDIGADDYLVKPFSPCAGSAWRRGRRSSAAKATVFRKNTAKKQALSQ